MQITPMTYLLGSDTEIHRRPHTYSPVQMRFHYYALECRRFLNTFFSQCRKERMLKKTNHYLLYESGVVSD